MLIAHDAGDQLYIVYNVIVRRLIFVHLNYLAVRVGIVMKTSNAV